MHVVRRTLLAFAAAVVTAAPLSAQKVIGNWSGSERSWNNADMALTKALMISQGHTVAPDAAISAANLATYDAFVIGQGTLTPGAGELADLASWIGGGGRLLILWDSGDSGNPANNAILAGIGSALSAGGSPVLAPFAPGNFATEGPPYNIVGQNLATTPGTAVVGGTALAGSYLHFQAYGSGFIFGFGDRSDHNAFAPSTANRNGQLLLNIVGGSGAVIPEPATVALVGGGLLVLVGIRLRRRV